MLSTRLKRTKTPDEALAALMRLCARAEKSSGDAMRLMDRWGVEPAQRQPVLQRLVAAGFIDDRRYAEAFVREKIRLSGWGAIKIRTALRRKGVDKTTIDGALAAIDGRQLEQRLAERLRKKAATVRYGSTYELKNKLVRYGLSLGYDLETVLDQTESLLRTTDTCPEDFL